MRFRSRQRMRSQADFAAVRNEGRRQFGAAFVFSYRSRPAALVGDLPRFAVVASRRVGGAVVRNRLKRQLREIFRAAQASIPPEFDVVAVLRPGADRATFADLERQFRGAMRRAGFSGGSRREVEPGDKPSDVRESDAPSSGA